MLAHWLAITRDDPKGFTEVERWSTGAVGQEMEAVTEDEEEPAFICYRVVFVVI